MLTVLIINPKKVVVVCYLTGHVGCRDVSRLRPPTSLAVFNMLTVIGLNSYNVRFHRMY